MSFYSEEELQEVGLAWVGKNVQLSRRVSLHGAARIAIGNNSRIDDFCVLSAGTGGIEIGAHVHISCMVSMIGRGKISIGDFAGLSGRVSVYSSNDDYSGAHMTNPTIPEHLTCVDHSEVTIGRHALVGAGSIILPGAIVEDGVVVGALSLVNDRLLRNTIYGGVPAKLIRPRQTAMYDFEQRLID
jgi:acetyltransferase-like isoleucine patch superfamily enzyme